MGGPATINGQSHPETNNFLPCKFVINGITYSSAENYFQCAKTTNEKDRNMVLKSGAGFSVYKAGQNVKLRSDWEIVKVDEMYKGNFAKFQQNEDLKRELLSSGTSPILFSKTSFWNKWNELILERVRAELRQNGEEDSKRAAEIKDLMDIFAQRKK